MPKTPEPEILSIDQWTVVIKLKANTIEGYFTDIEIRCDPACSKLMDEGDIPDAQYTVGYNIP